MRKSEENNKFRKKENAKKQYGSKSERPENTSAHRENVILQKNVAAASIREWIMKSSSTRNSGK